MDRKPGFPQNVAGLVEAHRTLEVTDDCSIATVVKRIVLVHPSPETLSEQLLTVCCWRGVGWIVFPVP